MAQTSCYPHHTSGKTWGLKSEFNLLFIANSIFIQEGREKSWVRCHRPIVLSAWESETGGQHAQGLPRLQSTFKASLINLARPHLGGKSNMCVHTYIHIYILKEV